MVQALRFELRLPFEETVLQTAAAIAVSALLAQLAEKVGFQPTVVFKLRLLSRQEA